MKKISLLLSVLLVIVCAFANIVSALDQTSTGFYYPIGKSSFDQGCGKWLGRDAKNGGCYFDGLYHIGVDMMTRDVNAKVYAIANGEIFHRHCPKESGGDVGWGPDNCALFIRHKTVDGNVFTGLYGHLFKDSLPESNEVLAGHEIGKTGNYSGGIHLHFGIRWGYSKSPDPWGMMKNDDWPEDNNFIDPLAFIQRERPFSKDTVTIASQSNYAWTKGVSESCEDGKTHYRLDYFGSVIPIAKDNACREVIRMCSNPPIQGRVRRSSKQSFNPFTDDFWSSVWKAVSNSAHDLFGANLAKACEDHIVYRTIRIKDSGEAQVVSNPQSDVKVFHPESASLTVPVTKPDPLPDLQIQKKEVFDEDYLLTEERSYLETGKTYQLHLWPISQKENCRKGIKKGKDTVETDTFYKIEDEGWKFVGRSYTQCEHLVEDDSKKEVLSFTVPEEATGKKICFKSKVDSTGEVRETDEHNNWSDKECYLADAGVHYPDHITTNFSLTQNRTSLSLGDRFGLKVVLSNLGNAPATKDVRLKYSLMFPNTETWVYQTDDKVTRDQLCAGCSKDEETKDDPFEANQTGIWQALVCTGYEERELLYDNNCAWFYFEVTAGPEKGPDYIATDASLTGRRTVLKLGDRFGIRGVSTNKGNENSKEDTRLGYYLMRPGGGEYKLQDSDKVTANQMCVNCSHEELTQNDPFVADAIGVWQVLVCASYEYKAKELNYENNCFPWFSFEVKPDYGFQWSYAGTISGKTCVNFWEGADPHTWGDNYLCSKDNLNIQWSPAGPINNMRCTQINESANPPEHTWADNYLCVPHDSPIFFSWSSDGPVAGKECLQINEPAEPPAHTWEDNWLCY